MLSPHVWLERHPYLLRSFVALLVMVSFVAPTWHVCSMGGHVMEMTSEHSGMSGMAHASTAKFLQSASGALICYCAPTHRDEKFPVKSKFVLNGRMTHDSSCLAMLLSGMPTVAAVSVLKLQVLFVNFSLWFPLRRDFPARELIRTFSGRGPPQGVCISPSI
jgi:hypothetical protein